MVRTFQLTKALDPADGDRQHDARRHRPARARASSSRLVQPLWRAQEAEIEARADELLDRFKLAHKRDEYAGALSGGQRKLLEMARALMADPRMVMLDEPMAGVNPALTQSLLGHIKGLRDEGMTVLFVEHDMDVVHDISRLGGGDGRGPDHRRGHRPTRSAPTNPAVIDAYLGAHHDHRSRRRGAGSARRGRGRSSRRSWQHDDGRATPPIPPIEARPTPSPRTTGSARSLEADDVVAGYVPGVEHPQRLQPRAYPRASWSASSAPTAPASRRCSRRMFGLVPVRSGQRHAARASDITDLKAHELVAHGRRLRAAEQQRLPVADRRGEPPDGAVPAAQGVRPSGFDEVCELFPLLGERRKQRAGSLSGGERQMVAMGRALMMEPVGAAARRALGRPVARAARTRSSSAAGRSTRPASSIVMVEQNARRCLQICDRGYVLDQGRNAYTGTGEELLNDPKVIELYLGTLAKAR